MSAADQIALPLDWPQSHAADRFIPSAANEAVLEHLARWTMWPVKATVITGPRRSGRSLLARTYVEKVGGRLFDDAQRHDEEALFHAWNAAQDSGKPLVLVADEAPPAWAVDLPDLRTRLAVTPVASIEQPDDRLFEALLALHFADRGLHLGPEACAFLAARIERSYFAAERVVEAIDRFAIAERARLTIPTIRRALERVGSDGERGAA
ncbi:HdaA/DnaA family protein [Sphingomicrobium lutaoense]|uniref:Chromosomal replication initiation ATPase DnaA n=1 Tax=Sphingomicrobium lutaoense TaxID=515949 RepID=A0A839YWQ4_9SPHN|nr:DnaA/Hda family protein [Sphingomicrobium lutaoense]MBB3763619.1 chromosomal replication initiation ATPase DnaA [Sphingomicrobium lutaoense]